MKYRTFRTIVITVLLGLVSATAYLAFRDGPAEAPAPSTYGHP